MYYFIFIVHLLLILVLLKYIWRTTPFVQYFTLSFANGHIFSDGPWNVTVGIRSVLDRRFGGGQF